MPNLTHKVREFTYNRDDGKEIGQSVFLMLFTKGITLNSKNKSKTQIG